MYHDREKNAGDSAPYSSKFRKRYRSRELVEAISETNVAEVATWWTDE